MYLSEQEQWPYMNITRMNIRTLSFVILFKLGIVDSYCLIYKNHQENLHFTFLYVYLFTYNCLSLHLYLSIYLSISVCLSIYQSTYLSIYMYLFNRNLMFCRDVKVHYILISLYILCLYLTKMLKKIRSPNPLKMSFVFFIK